MKSAQSESVVVEVGPHAFSVKVSLAQDVNKQPQKAMLKPSSLDYSDGNESSWILVTSYNKRNRRRAGSRAKPSSRKKSMFNTKIGHKQARRTVQSLPVEFAVKPPVLVACAFEKAQLLVKATVPNPKVSSLDAPSCAVVMAHTPALPASRVPLDAVSLTQPALSVIPCEPQVPLKIHRAANKEMTAHLVAPPAVPAQPLDKVQPALEVDSAVPLAPQAAPVVSPVLHILSTASAAPSAASALPCQTAVAAAVGPDTACPALPAALPKSANRSQVCCLQYKSQNTPFTSPNGTCSQGGKVPFVSLWRLVYGMLFAMLLQLDLCGAAPVAAGANPPPPPPRHTLWKDPPGVGAVARGALAATPALPEETSRLRGHKELQSVHSSHPAALSNFQNVSTNGTDSTNTTNSIHYAWQSVYLGSYGAIACSDNGQHVVAGNYH
eukprot:gene16582-18912_t